MSIDTTVNAILHIPKYTKSPKECPVTAIVLGILVGLAGIGGTLGLLQSYNLISLPKELSFLGNLHKGALCLISIVGVVGGGLIIAIGSYKVHHARKKDKAEKECQDKKAVEDNFSAAAPEQGSCVLSYDYSQIGQRQYIHQFFRHKGQDVQLIVLKNQENEIEFSPLISKDQDLAFLIRLLTAEGYIQLSKELAAPINEKQEKARVGLRLTSSFGDKFTEIGMEKTQFYTMLSKNGSWRLESNGESQVFFVRIEGRNELTCTCLYSQADERLNEIKKDLNAWSGYVAESSKVDLGED